MSNRSKADSVAMQELINTSLVYLSRCATTVQNKELSQACLHVLNDPAFRLCTASATKHQAYRGGLLVHTAEVMETALLMAKSQHLAIDLDVIITSVIYHDYGKIYDYEKNPNPAQIDQPFVYTTHQKMIRHLPRSYAMFMQQIGDSVSAEIVTAISHCILAHHGRREWGSPVEPLTPEALIVHFSDDLSASYAQKSYIRKL